MADYRTPCSGNFIASLLELAEKMRDAGNTVCFLFLEHRNGGGYTWSGWLEENGFSVSLLNEQMRMDDVLNYLTEMIRQKHIDIIHSHFGLYHRLLIQNAGKLGVKVVFHDHMDFSPEGNMAKQKLRCLVHSAVYRITGIHVVSVMKQKSQAYLFCGRKLNHYVPNGLSFRRNAPNDVTREVRREQLGISPDDKLCLLLGWDKYGKGVDIAVRAVEYYRRTDPSLHLGFIGLGCPPYQGTLDWIAEKTGVDPQSQWLHFFPSFEDMFACYRAADVFLSASRKEAFSYALLEAISQNTPVVMSNVEGTAWAQPYSRCAVYPTEDVQACAAAIKKALGFCEIPSNAEEIVSKYSIDLWCERIMEIYQKVLA